MLRWRRPWNCASPGSRGALGATSVLMVETRAPPSGRASACHPGDPSNHQIAAFRPGSHPGPAPAHRTRRRRVLRAGPPSRARPWPQRRAGQSPDRYRAPHHESRAARRHSRCGYRRTALPAPVPAPPLQSPVAGGRLRATRGRRKLPLPLPRANLRHRSAREAALPSRGQVHRSAQAAARRATFPARPLSGVSANASRRTSHPS